MIRCSLAEPQPQARIDGILFHEWKAPGGTTWAQFYRLEIGYLVRFPTLADFEVGLIDDCVVCHPVPGVDSHVCEHLFLNQVRPLALSDKGKLVFHASAVEIGDGAVAFLGASGRGKSTLAASFATSGYRFLTDDGLLLEPSGDRFMVQPSDGSVRLWGDSRAAITKPGIASAPALPYTPKERLLAGDEIQFCREPRPLVRAYLLGETPIAHPAMRSIKGAEALVEWVKHSFLLDLQKRTLLASHFDQVARLVACVECFVIEFPRRYEDLPRLRQFITDNVRP